MIADRVEEATAAVGSRVRGLKSWRRPPLIHIVMFAICAILLLFDVFTTRLISASNLGMESILVAAPLLIAPALVPAAYWHQRGNADKRDAALTLPWVILLIAIIPYVVVISGRLRFPLRDQSFLILDQHLGFSVPAIMAWASRYPRLEDLLNRSYNLLYWMVALAVLLPALLGKRKAAQEFVLANGIVFLLSVPLFTLFPAIGPWVVYHFPPNPIQQACELSIRTLHQSAPSTPVEAFGIVCFPSFHTIWAVLSAVALQSIRLLRVPAVLLAGLIMASTMTTGWHYATDVVGGLLMSVIALAGARLVLRLQDRI